MDDDLIQRQCLQIKQNLELKKQLKYTYYVTLTTSLELAADGVKHPRKSFLLTFLYKLS